MDNMRRRRLLEASESAKQQKLSERKMKRIIATSVMGAFLLTAPAVFASDKAPLDTPAKGSVKSEAAPVVKKPEAAAVVIPSAVVKQDAATSAKADAAKSADKAAPEKAEAAKTEAPKATPVKAEDAKAPVKSDAVKATGKSATARPAALDVKPVKEAKPEAKPVTVKPAGAAKTTAEAPKKGGAPTVTAN